MATKKTTTAKTTTKAVKPAAKKPAVKAAKPAVGKIKTLSEADIRKKAEEIYHERMKKGLHGTPEEDWHNAEALLKGKKK